MTRGRFTCFFHPKEDMSEHDMSDPCPECTRLYSYPLENAPGTIRDYQIVEPLGRGFYAATYSATYGSLGTKVVLKVTPKDTYSHFKKDFDAENRLHLEVAQGTQHLANIADAFDYDVKFGDTVISCHVASLQYIAGPTLGKFLADPDNRTARNLAQISVDLFNLMQELSSKQLYHNDLHDNNIIIEQLDRRSYRSGETIEPSIRAIAIDLGSLSEMSKSVPLGNRLGDLLQVVRYILNFRNYLLENPSSLSDVEYRLAIQLDQIGHMLAPDPLSQKEPPYGDIITQLQVGFGRSNSPWKAPSELTSFSESYNAQTLHPGFVRQLLVDPDGEWLASVSGKGPQVITGIRGCGKTMLLKAMQSHSQIIHHVEQSSDIDEAIVNIEKEGYVGLYVPTNRLLDTLGSTSGPVHEPYARLFVAYALEAIRAARHLGELKPSVMSPGYWQYVGKVATAYIKGTSGLNEAPTVTALENQLFAILVSLDRGEDLYTLAGSPAVAFPQLADAVRLTSNVWTNATVLYLLDDVSTRNLGKSDIGDLLGTLLFAHPNCAFKMTTEVQTMELLLKSPGLVETARVGRDYDTFDLAAKVVDRLNNGKGIEFVERILTSRSRFYPKHPAHEPRRLLGEASLEQIARDIATTTPNAAQKKEVYRGINALTALCVGDIGDILKIYEAILTHFDGSTLPISFAKQSGEFQEYCSKQLYHLNRRKGELKDFALSFARAAHSLLVKSSRTAETAKRRQLRQHTQIYVGITTGDMVWQFEKLRELVDAGVFVLRGGPDVPRTKTRDSNPTQHFILTYRKLYGLSSFIGLSNRDRFELSGDDLLAWLENPASGDQILGKNLGLGEGQNNGDQPTGDIVFSNDNSAHSNKEDDHQLAMEMVIVDRKGAVADNEQLMSADNIQTATSYADSVSRLPIITEIADISDDSGSVRGDRVRREPRQRPAARRRRTPDPGYGYVEELRHDRLPRRLHAGAGRLRRAGRQAAGAAGLLRRRFRPEGRGGRPRGPRGLRARHVRPLPGAARPRPGDPARARPLPLHAGRGLLPARRHLFDGPRFALVRAAADRRGEGRGGTGEHLRQHVRRPRAHLHRLTGRADQRRPAPDLPLHPRAERFLGVVAGSRKSVRASRTARYSFGTQIRRCRGRKQAPRQTTRGTLEVLVSTPIELRFGQLPSPLFSLNPLFFGQLRQDAPNNAPAAAKTSFCLKGEEVRFVGHARPFADLPETKGLFLMPGFQQNIQYRVFQMTYPNQSVLLRSMFAHLRPPEVTIPLKSEGFNHLRQRHRKGEGKSTIRRCTSYLRSLRFCRMSEPGAT